MATWQQTVRIALEYPGIEESISYGEPSLKVRKSLITRWRKADNSIVLMGVDYYERDRLLADEPNVYFMEPHYAAHEIVLARLSVVNLSIITMFIERRWRSVAPKKLVAERDLSSENKDF